MELTQNIKSTITFLEKYLPTATFEEICRFLPIAANREQIADTIQKHREIFVTQDDYVAFIGVDISKLIQTRLAREDEMKTFLLAKKQMINKIMANKNIIFIGLEPFNKNEMLIIGAENYQLPRPYGRGMLKCPLSEHYQLSKSMKHASIFWNQADQITKSIADIDMQFKLLNMAVIKNTDNIYQQILGLMFGSNLRFPNYPLSALNGVRYSRKIDLPNTTKTGLFRFFH